MSIELPLLFQKRFSTPRYLRKLDGMKVCRWGILGTAGIARKHWRGIKSTGNATITAVASRTLDGAQRFHRRVPRGCSLSHMTFTQSAPYEALLERDDVDAVYIPCNRSAAHG